MDTEKVIALLSKYEDGTISSEEKALLESWYIKQANESKHQLSKDAIEESFYYLKAQLPVKATKTVKLWPRIAIASAIAFFVIGAYFFRSSFTATDKDNTAYMAADVAPGRNGATLTLANGTKILINDALAGNIASQSGVKISKTKDGQIIYEVTNQGTNKIEYNTLTTTRGEQTQVRLPDGSLVFLNAASSLRYPTSFAKSAQRRVGLTGEGYFEIAKDKAHPFVVTTAKQEVEVLGTHFNINAYTDEKTVRTTLMEGSVKVAPLSVKGSDANMKGHVLKPGQQSALDEKGIKVADVNLDEVIAWKEGNFMFKSETIGEIMRKVQRWYDVEVVYTEPGLADIKFSGTISRYEHVSKLLDILQTTELIHFKIEGRKVIVSK